MVFQGLGQYKCEVCGFVEHDDYGKVRNYIEEHPGANVTMISDATGVSRRSINNMVKENRFEITKDSRTFLLCEMCGVNIRSGRVCPNCEAAYHKSYEEEIRRLNVIGGYVKADRSEDSSGSKRFKREIF
jgi:rubrerythrin